LSGVVPSRRRRTSRSLAISAIGYTETYQPKATDPVEQAKEIGVVEGRVFMELARIGDQAIAARRKQHGK
jgi:hypothetical protein